MSGKRGYTGLIITGIIVLSIIGYFIWKFNFKPNYTLKFNVSSNNELLSNIPIKIDGSKIGYTDNKGVLLHRLHIDEGDEFYLEFEKSLVIDDEEELDSIEVYYDTLRMEKVNYKVPYKIIDLIIED